MIARHLQEWFDAGAVDGFGVQPDLNETDIDTFVDEVIPPAGPRDPPTEYDGTTLRSHLRVRRGGSPIFHRERSGSPPRTRSVGSFIVKDRSLAVSLEEGSPVPVSTDVASQTHHLYKVALRAVVHRLRAVG